MEKNVVTDNDIALQADDFLARFTLKDLDAYSAQLEQRIAAAVRAEDVGEEIKVVREIELLEVEEPLARVEADLQESIDALDDYILRQRVFLAVNVGIPRLLLDSARLASREAEVHRGAAAQGDLEFLASFEELCGLE